MENNLTEKYNHLKNKWNAWRYKTALKYYRKLDVDLDDCLQIIDIGLFVCLKRADKKGLQGEHKTMWILKATVWYLLSETRAEQAYKCRRVDTDFDFNYSANSAEYESRYIFWITVEYIRSGLNPRCQAILDMLIKGYNGRDISRKWKCAHQGIYQLINKYIRPAFRKEGLTL